MSLNPFSPSFFQNKISENSYLCLNADNQIEVVEKKRRRKSLFSFKQDGNLLAVNRRLQQALQLNNPFFHELKKDDKRWNHFKENISILNAKFLKGNAKSRLTLIVVALINMFRKVFRLAPITFQNYQLIDAAAFVKRNAMAALPDVIIPEIGKFLDFKDIRQLARVDKRTKKVLYKHALEEENAFFTAMDLMFEHRSLKWGYFNPIFSKGRPNQLILDERYGQLKIALLKIKTQINCTIAYREGMMSYSVTLLLQAINQISDPIRRREIVRILLAKGADPRRNGFYYQEIDVIKSAESDPELHGMLLEAVKKLEEAKQD